MNRSRRSGLALLTIAALMLPTAASALPPQIKKLRMGHKNVSQPDASSAMGGDTVRKLEIKVELGYDEDEYPFDAPWCVEQRKVFFDRYNNAEDKWEQLKADESNADGIAKVLLNDRQGKYRARVKALEAPEGEEIDCFAGTQGLGKHEH